MFSYHFHKSCRDGVSTSRRFRAQGFNALQVTGWMVKCCMLSRISGRLSMMLARVSNDVAGAPIVCCTVVEKCTFSSPGSIRRGLGLGLGLGLRIR